MKLLHILSISLALAPSALAQPPCYEANIGANLNLSDDDVAVNQALGFAFPFAGTTVANVSISSNGFVWLAPSTASGCCDGEVFQFLSGLPRIAPLWTDLDPSSGGSVHLATFPGRAVITWFQVPEYGESSSLTFQLQLLSDGSMVMFWDSGVAIASHSTLVGMTPGRGASNPGNTDITARLPFDTGTSPTMYELFSPTRVDLGGTVIRLEPNANGGYRVSALGGCQFGSFRQVGQGCPPVRPLTLFGGTNGPPNRGTTFQMVFGEAPVGAMGAFLIASTTDAGGLPLDPFGLTGCRLYAALDLAGPVALQGRYSAVDLQIPDTNWVVGTVLFVQTGIVAPGANPGGIVTSNGGRIEIGS